MSALPIEDFTPTLPVPCCGHDVLTLLRTLGVSASLDADGQRFRLSGLSDLDDESRCLIIDWARIHREAVLHWLRQDAMPSDALEGAFYADMRAAFPLRCIYATAHGAGEAMAAHHLSGRVLGDDFVLDIDRLPKGFAADALYFVRHNAPLILRHLKECSHE